jgi:hypothetical protein
MSATEDMSFADHIKKIRENRNEAIFKLVREVSMITSDRTDIIDVPKDINLDDIKGIMYGTRGNWKCLRVQDENRIYFTKIEREQVLSCRSYEHPLCESLEVVEFHIRYTLNILLNNKSIVFDKEIIASQMSTIKSIIDKSNGRKVILANENAPEIIANGLHPEVSNELRKAGMHISRSFTNGKTTSIALTYSAI